MGDPVPNSREPSCRHDSHQPASACVDCKRLADAWSRDWDLFLVRNPDHPVAQEAQAYRERHPL